MGWCEVGPALPGWMCTGKDQGLPRFIVGVPTALYFKHISTKWVKGGPIQGDKERLDFPVCLCLQISLFYKDTNCIGAQCTLVTSL